jgi:hypothetical protein
MAANPQAQTPEKQNLQASFTAKPLPPWARFAQILFIIAFAAVVYLLCLSMVHHSFFRGGRIDKYGYVR